MLQFLKFFCFTILSAILSPLCAQSIPNNILYDKLDPFHQSQSLPKEQSLPASDEFDFTLPPIKTPAQPDNKLFTSVNIWLNEIKLTGNTLLSKQQLISIIKKYLNRYTSLYEIEQLRHELTLVYIHAGYINSGIIIPDQDINNGKITLHVIEGQLSKVNIHQLKSINPEYITARFNWNDQKPLNIHQLQQSLLLLQQDPLIKQLNAKLKPGSQPGQSYLDLNIKEAIPYQLNFQVDNYRSPSIGANHRQLSLIHQNLTGSGDLYELQFGETNGMIDFLLAYEYEFLKKGLRLRLYQQGSKSNVIESPFDILNISNRSRSSGISIEKKIQQTPQQYFVVKALLELRESDTFLSGIPFSFSAGVNKGNSKVSAFRLINEWISRSPSSVIAIRSRFSLGLSAFNSTKNIDSPDSQFFTWLSQVQYIKRLSTHNDQLMFKAAFQIANSGLLPIEKYSVGGSTSVRGYRENALVRDQGVITSIEYRLPIRIGRLSDDQLKLSIFIDYGWSENRTGDTQFPRDISSAGIGLLWQPNAHLSTELFIAKPFRKIQQDNYNIQDDGVHGMIKYQFQ